MNDDYLWDKTGQPDPEIQQLETILGELRYQPRPLVIPNDAQVKGRPSFVHRFQLPVAIAAAITILVVGLGIWFGLQRFAGNDGLVAKAPTKSGPAPAPTATTKPEMNVDVAASNQDQDPPRVIPTSGSRPRKVRRIASPTRRQFTAEEQQQALAVKEQLMLGLRLASVKLNLAQKKTQSTNSREPIHNQHKVG